MHPPLSKQPQPEPENKYPNCLYMELAGTFVQPNNPAHLAFWTTSIQKQPIDLYLTIHFNEQWVSLDQGRVKFGLKGGELRLKLSNGEIPHESRALVGFFELYPLKTMQELQGSPTRKHTQGREFAIAQSAPTTPITSGSICSMRH